MVYNYQHLLVYFWIRNILSLIYPFKDTVVYDIQEHHDSKFIAIFQRSHLDRHLLSRILTRYDNEVSDRPDEKCPLKLMNSEKRVVHLTCHPC